MDIELAGLLTETTLASSAAVLLMLALRRPVRAALGAGAAYALWLCVPVALVAVLLPRGADVPLALPVAWDAAPMAVAALAQAPGGFDWRAMLLPLWLAGSLASVGLAAWQQRRFLRRLGPLGRRGDGCYESPHAVAGLPAVCGLLRPRIVLPADFGSRYTEGEQALVLQHERLHVRRGDLFANALAALLRCLFWFNPLLALASRRFRLDQELACDEAVIARNPSARRAYGEAMLKTQFAELPLPLGCHWQATHPLKERIAMLRRPTPSPLRWMSALLLTLLISAFAGYAAWAAQPGEAMGASSAGGRFLLTRQTAYGGEAGTGVLNQFVDAGKPAVSMVGAGADRWKNTAVVLPGRQPGTVLVRMTLERGEPGQVVATPAVLVREGEASAIEQRDASGTVVYRTVFRVIPAEGTNEEASERMRKLMSSAEGASVASTPAAADEDAAAVENRMPPPVYPVEAARQYIGGEVILLVTVAPSGEVREVVVEKSTPAGVFDAVSLEAARQWKFKPAMRDGVPVEGQVRVPVRFSAAPTEEEADAAS